MTAVALNPAVDVTAGARTLGARGRARVAGVLTPEAAQALHGALADDGLAWRRSLDNPANVDVPVSVFEGQPVDEQARLIAMVHEGARDGFQYVYDRFRIGYGVQPARRCRRRWPNSTPCSTAIRGWSSRGA